MTQTLAERFAHGHGAPLDVNGVIVHSIYRKLVSAGQRVRVRRFHAVSEPVQGIRIKLDGGVLNVNEQNLNDVVLWADTAPHEVELVCGGAHELRVWNCWRDQRGTTQAWIGDAGMAIGETANTVLLKCIAGTHGFSPTDLEIELQF